MPAKVVANTVFSKPKTSKREAKRRAILEAAARLFAQKGYNATTLQDIAAVAGTQAGSLYYHFSSRDDIVREVLSASMAVIEQQVRAAIKEAESKSGTYLERIKAGVRVHLRAVLSADPYTSAYFRIINEVPAPVYREFIEQPRAYGRYWHKLILAAQESGEIRRDIDPSVFRMLLLGGATYAQMWFSPKGRLNMDQVSDVLLDVYLNGALPATRSAAKPVASASRRRLAS